MEEGTEETVGEVLYEIRQHARRPFSLDLYQQQIRTGGKGGLLSYLSVQGINNLKEKWNEYNRPRTFNKRVSLFISPNAEHVAVAAENQIIILQKDDNYMEPCGIFFSNDRLTVFKDGAWSEPQGILGVIDDKSMLYFIKSNGEEITRRTRSQLKLPAPLIGLIVQDDLNAKKSCLCGFCIFTTDGLLHHVEVTQEPSACIYSIPITNNHLTVKKKLPDNVSCLDFHPDLSWAVLVGASSVSENSKDYPGFYSLYLLRVTTNSELELLFCTPHYEGIFASPKGHVSPFTSPKVAISPQGKYVAVLDLTGCLDIFNLDDELYSVSLLYFGERQDRHISDNVVLGKQKCLNDIVDISWWSDHILILAKGNGSVTMFNILNGKIVLENGPVLDMPVIERAKHHHGFVFVLEGTSSRERISTFEHKKEMKMQHIEHAAVENYNHLDPGKMCWSLMSFSETSVSEMYTILISNRQYQAAFDFANHHGLDRDEIFKAQWLNSEKGIHEINMFLSKIKDQMFVLSECVDKVGPTEEVVKALLSYGIHTTDQYRFSESDDRECRMIWDFRLFRLQLLQCRDRLETFVGINMGRFSPYEYNAFRVVPLTEAAVTLAESGKIGALNLLFKRHPYSLCHNVLDILSAIPETVPVQSYGQLLPGRSPPSTVALRDGDWVECEKMVSFISELPSGSEKSIQWKTEIILKHSMGFVWPSVTELSEWYKNRARDIDNLSGQLDNCLSLLDFACRKGIVELQQFLEDTSYLHQLIYSGGCDEDFTMSLVVWEQLSNYDKFKMMLKGVREDTVVARLREKAIPFMLNRFFSKSLASKDQMKEDQCSIDCEQRHSFLVRWLKEIAAENKLEICLAVIEEGCGDSPIDGLFKDEAETVETILQCIYLCTLTDQWNMMASILSKLPRKTLREKSSLVDKDFSPRHGTRGFGTPRFSFKNHQFTNSDGQTDSVSLNTGDSTQRNSKGCLDIDASADNLEKKIKIAEGHVEVGRLLAYYQVPKPMRFFLDSESDEKNVKQLLRLILSKFGRRQPGRSDNDWANMWRDMQCFQEKAFPFLDIEYMLIEFCRGLLKAGKFSLARNYLKGTGTITLATEKAENLVIQAAREYFFSASSLACTEIWKAKECLSLFPNSNSVKAESDIIDALTIKLPNLGVTLLPMQFRQIRNPMEIINMVIASQTGAYLNVEELIEIAKLLGLSSQDDIAAVEEAVAREAAVAGDLQLAFDLCLVLAKKGHGPIWDLCAAIARGPHLENMDTDSRKQLLGFALSHCDEESIGELLHAWKDVDMQIQCEKLITSTGTNPPNFSVQRSSLRSLPMHSVKDIFNLRDSSEPVHSPPFIESGNDDQVHFDSIKDMLSSVGKDSPIGGGDSWDSLLGENRKVLSFAALELPWLLELSRNAEYGKKAISGVKGPARKYYISIRMQALFSILSWLAGNDIAPSDNLIASLAKSVMEPPVTEEDDALGCSFLLNLMDAFHGVEIIEEQLKTREGYQEICSIMNIGMTYSSLHNSRIEYSSPDQRRRLLLDKFKEKHKSFSSDEIDQIDKVQSTFWREWKAKLEEQKRLADQARALEQIIPGIESARFISGDIKYVESVVFSFVDSVKLEKKHILKEAVKLADAYGLHRTEVLLRFLGCALVSEHWGNDDILAEISEYREDIVTSAKGVIDMIASVVYPEIDGHDKQRLSYIYSILSACYLRLRRSEEPAVIRHQDPEHMHILESFQFYKVLEQECQRVSFIKELNFKNIAGLYDLNFEKFNEEICNNIHETTVEALAVMVQTLLNMYDDSQVKGVTSWQDVYKHHVLCLLATLETGNEARSSYVSPDELQELIVEIDLKYDSCKNYIRALSEADKSYVIGRYYTVCVPYNFSGIPSDESAWKDCLFVLLDFWIKLANDIQETVSSETSHGKPISFNTESLSRCLKVFKKLVMEEEVSANQGWCTISDYVKLGAVAGLNTYISCFCRAMIFSGCLFKAIANVFCEAEPHTTSLCLDGFQKNLLNLYIHLTETVLLDLGRGAGERRNLYHLLSSLSRVKSECTEDLKMIRCAVWEKLSTFADNMQLESHIRVYALQLMQSVTGRNLRNLPVGLFSEVETWEAWDESSCTKTNVTADRVDVSSSITSNLVALKSTQLVSAISPNIKITPDDLLTLDSAVSCFLHVSEAATSVPNLNVLQAVLEEWEELFSTRTDKEKSSESLEEVNNWSSDEWDEGWENLAEEPVKREGKEDASVFVCPLHTCWMEIIKKLVQLSQLGAVVDLLDRSLSKSDCILLAEDEAQSLFQLVIGIDCFMGMEMMLLLPYEALRFQCLSVVESKLKHGGISTMIGGDNCEFLTLIVSSGMLPKIATDSAYCKVFSYFCYSVGHLARLCQEDLLRYKHGDGSRTKGNGLLLFDKVLFPCFVSELVKAGQYLLAGFIVSQWMHTHASLSLINVVEASLRRYLEGQVLQMQPSGDESSLAEMDFSRSLVNTISSLRGKLGSLLKSALLALPTDAVK